MPGYFAEIADGQVVRVLVCNDPGWLTDRFGGVWVETADPYSDVPQTIAYCGPGWGYDDRWPERFAPKWVQPQGAGVEDAEPYPVGTRVWHDGRIWRSTVANNVWEPGISGWHDDPAEGIPAWVQPTGAHDAYPKGAQVHHNGTDWTSDLDGNVWEPGVHGWTQA